MFWDTLSALNKRLICKQFIIITYLKTTNSGDRNNVLKVTKIHTHTHTRIHTRTYTHTLFVRLIYLHSSHSVASSHSNTTKQIIDGNRYTPLF